MKIFIGATAIMAALLAGCGGATAPFEGESQGGVATVNAAQISPQTPPQGAPGIRRPARSGLPSRPAPTAPPSQGGQWLLRSPAPPKVVAQSRSDISEAAAAAADAQRNFRANPRRGARWIDSARVGLLQGAPEGATFLAAPRARALARGEPAESCPAVSVATGGSPDQTVRAALNRCFDALDGRADCGCRLMAQGSQLLARERDFAYATGVNATLYGRDYNGAPLIAEERALVETPGARRVWLLSPIGLTAMGLLAPDGRAALLFATNGERYDGVHRAEGLRRGRIARKLFLRGADGDRLTALIGFEPVELEERGGELRQWEE